MNVTEEEQLIKNKSGEPTVRNRLRWGIHYLRHAGLIDVYQEVNTLIPKEEKRVREEYGLDIDNKTLENFEEFLNFKNQVKSYGDLQRKILKQMRRPSLN